jgi:hypothetical protein
MKNSTCLWLLLVATLVVAGCSSDDDDGPSTPPVATDQEVLAAAWTGYEGGDWATAEENFRELLGRGTLPAESHDGLGWTFAAQNAADSSLVHFTAALAARADTTAIADQAQAGLAFAAAAGGEFQQCLDAAGAVAAGWVFAHDDRYDRDQVTLLEAAAHYALGDFEASLAAVQELEPDFTVDVETVEGRADLAAMIEELQI